MLSDPTLRLSESDSNEDTPSPVSRSINRAAALASINQSLRRELKEHNASKRFAMAGGEAAHGAIPTEDGDVVKKVARIKHHLASIENDGGAVLESLRQLQAVPMTFPALEATKIGWDVNALRKNASSEEARELAGALYRSWKALADKHFRSTRKQLPAAAAAAAAAPANVVAAAAASGNIVSAGNVVAAAAAPSGTNAVAGALPLTSKQATASHDKDRNVAKSAQCSSSPVKVPKCAAVTTGTSASKQTVETPARAGKAMAKRKLPPDSKDAAAVKKQRTVTPIAGGNTPGKVGNGIEKRRLPPENKNAVAVKKQRTATPIAGGNAPAGKAEKRRPVVVPQHTAAAAKPAPGKAEKPRPVAPPRVVQRQRTAAAATTKPAAASRPASGSKPMPNNRQAPPPATASLHAQKAPKRVTPPSAAAALTKPKPKPPQAAPPPRKPNGPGACKRKEMSMEDASRLAMAKRRLEERYKEATAIKEKRRIRVINVPVKTTRRADLSGKRSTRRSAPPPSAVRAGQFRRA
ncbi:hypothetical protein ACP4OV_019187 [Aristida adscensionis]